MLEFHFLRPAWLLLLPLGVWLAWRLTRSTSRGGRWRSVVDTALQPYVLTGGEVALRERRTILSAAVAGVVLATLALAGPTWERQPVPAFRSDEALVVVLDLSRSMDAADLEPSRLERAKLKLLALLEQRESGQTGLVVFSAHAFTVTPLTTDTRNVAALISSLSTDIMPSRGSYPEAGLNKGAQLLRQTGMMQGKLLLISDAEVSSVAEQVAEDLNAEGYTIHVLAVGTRDSAPIPQGGGGFLTDREGDVVVPRFDPRGLRRLSVLGGGRFATMTTDDRDLDSLLGTEPEAGGQLGSASADGESYQTDRWQDRGLWLALLLIPLVAIAFRRGWIVVCGLWLILPGEPAQALEWADLWWRPDQRGQRAFEAEEHASAAELFEDPAWAAAARYRAGDYAESAELLDGMDTAEAHYNRGNALARGGEFPAAIEAYDRALELDPGHEDARFNRELLLQQQQPESNQPQEGESQAQSTDSESEQTPAQPPPSQPDESQRAENLEPTRPEESQDTRASQTPTEAGTETGEPSEAEPLPSPGDLEEWASEQAAEQWLRRIPQDPGSLLRRKFQYQYQRLGVDQDGNYVWPGDEEQPW